MMAGSDERSVREDFGAYYGSRQGDIYADMERAVIGGDWGANGYTTIEEADEFGRALGLTRGVRLLDIGSGRGWPGLYLASATGCDVIATDLPIEGLVTGRTRAMQSACSGHAQFVVASVNALPFRAASFDAVVHTDVFC